MYNPYNIQMNIDRINQQINDLQKIRDSFQAIPQQQPIQNIINTGNSNNIDFEARFLNENEKVDEILVQRKTAFIDLNNARLSIKELNGDISNYDLIIPKTQEQLKIEELERKIEEYERRTNNEITESNSNDTITNESTTKSTSRTVFKKS